MFAFLRQKWKDERLAGVVNGTVILEGDAIDRAWVPDIYCINARKSNLMTQNKELHSILKIFRDGSMLYSRE